MSEFTIIQNSKSPLTRNGISARLVQLGVSPGHRLIVHSSLSSLGWVSGGAVAVVQALMDTVTDTGSIVMPTHSTGNSDPKYWENPAVPKDWWQTIRDSMPAYHPMYSETRGMGAIVDVFRSMPNVLRSAHPQSSFAAWGKDADWIIADHSLDSSLGDHSPLGKIYELDGYVLLLGVGHDSNTSFHLAEERNEGFPRRKQGSAIFVDGVRKWVEFTEAQYDSDRFEEIGTAFEEAHSFVSGMIGSAQVRLFKQRDLVDFAEGYIRERFIP